MNWKYAFILCFENDCAHLLPPVDFETFPVQLMPKAWRLDRPSKRPWRRQLASFTTAQIGCAMRAQISGSTSTQWQILNQNNYTHVRIRGLMGMASFTDNQIQIESEFKSLAQYYKQYQDQYVWDTLSMGMSGDYPLALSCGSTMIRVGSRIFGSRN